MANDMTKPVRDDKRRFVRLPYGTVVRYRYGAQEAGIETGLASVSNVGRGGIAVRMGRYLRPGTLVMVATGSQGADGDQKARIAWSEPLAGTAEFQAGLQIIHDEPSALAEMSLLVHRALIVSGRMAEASSRSEKGTDCWQMGSARQALPVAVGT